MVIKNSRGKEKFLLPIRCYWKRRIRMTECSPPSLYSTGCMTTFSYTTPSPPTPIHLPRAPVIETTTLLAMTLCSGTDYRRSAGKPLSSGSLSVTLTPGAPLAAATTTPLSSQDNRFRVCRHRSPGVETIFTTINLRRYKSK